MKILIIHGEDTESSFARYSEILDNARKTNWEIVVVNESPQGLATQARSQSLFTKKRLFVIYGFATLNKDDKTFLNKTSSDLSEYLVIYQPGLISKTGLGGLPKNIKVEERKLSKFVWIFLDSILPGNAKKAIEFYHKAAMQNSPEMLLAMLARHLVSLYLVKTPTNDLNLPSWRLTKLKGQAGGFSDQELADMIASLTNIDILVKTSQGELADLLDIFLATKLG